MDDYIKRTDVSQLICRRLPPAPLMKRNWDKWFKENEDLVLLGKEVDNLPWSDVAPVRHGEWIHPREYGLNLPEHYCSECKTWEYSDTESNYCPACGAKMDGEIK